MEVLVSGNPYSGGGAPEFYWAHLIQLLKGEWLPVKTEHLFNDQFNVDIPEEMKGALIEKALTTFRMDDTAMQKMVDYIKKSTGLRLMAAQVSEIRDDVRTNLEKCGWCGYSHNPLGSEECVKCGRTNLEPLDHNMRVTKRALKIRQRQKLNRMMSGTGESPFESFAARLLKSAQIVEADFDDQDMQHLYMRAKREREVRKLRRGINPNCDQQECRFENGDVKRFPDGNGNSIMCHDCFNKAMQYRKEFNLDPEGHFGVPDEAGEIMRSLTGRLGLLPILRWEDLPVYPEE